MFIYYWNTSQKHASCERWEAHLYKDDTRVEFLVVENTERKVLISIMEILTERPEFRHRIPPIVMAAGYEAGVKKLKQLHDKELENTRRKIQQYKRQITHLQNTLREKNLKLDALHHVWCSGGCNGGVHRWTPNTVNEDLVKMAEGCVARLRDWWDNYQYIKIYEQEIKESNVIRKPLDSLNKSLDTMRKVANLWFREDVTPIKHNQGSNPCNKVAFYWKGEIPIIQDRVESSRVIMLDGSVPDKNSRIVCGYCGMALDIITSYGVGSVFKFVD